MPLNGSLATVDATGKIIAAVEDVTVPDGFNGGTPLTAARQLTVTTATANLSKLAGLSYDTPGRLAESSAGPITAYVAGIPIDQQGRMVVANAAAVRYAPNAIPITATGAVALAGGVPPDSTAPTDPTGLLATPNSETQATLTWTASTDAVGVTLYRIERCTGAACVNFAEIATPAVTNYSDTGRTANTVYRYQVRARDAANNRSGYSAIATATTPDNTAPTAPTSLVATPDSETQITLTWTAATDNVAVTQYRIERCTGVACSSFAEIATDTASPYVDTGRTVNTTYRYQIRAQDAANNLGPYSNIATALTPDQTAPTAPTSLVATPDSGTQITLTWTAATDNVGVAGYRVERCTGAACVNFAQIGTDTASPFVDTGLTAGITYRYQVRAEDAVPNLGPYSNIAEAVTTAPPSGAISPPDLFAAGELGGWWDPSDLSTMFQDTAATTPVTTVGQSVARINDKSGRGNHLLQATAANRPIYQIDTNGKPHLVFDGTDDFMLVNPMSLTASDAITVWLGFNKTGEKAAHQMMMEHSTILDSNAGTFYLLEPASTARYDFRSRGSNATGSTAQSTVTAGSFTSVFTGQSDISSDTNIARVNGVQTGTASADQGTGNFGTFGFYVGRRGGSTLPFGGRLYGLIVRNLASTAQHVIDIERWLAEKSGVPISLTPSDLFTVGELGAWYDPSDMSTLFQDTAGATPVTASGQTVGLIRDKSGRGLHLTQATAGSRPTFIDSGGLRSLQFDGVDDWMISASTNFGAGGGIINLWAGLFTDTNTGVGLVAELSATSSGNVGTWALQAPPGDLDGFYWRSKGTVDTTLDVDGVAHPSTHVVQCQAGISSDFSAIRVDGVQALQTLADQGTGPHGTFPVYMGRRGGSTLPFKGRLYGLFFRHAATTAQTLADMEQWLAKKTGITFTST